MMDATVKIRGRSLDVRFHVSDIKTSRDGIGHYEFWGARCFDRGRVGLDDFKALGLVVHSDRRDEYLPPSPRLAKALLTAIYNDEDIEERILENAEQDIIAARYEAAERKYEERRDSELL